MKKTKAKELLKKYQDGTCTEEEKAMIETWYIRHKIPDPAFLSEGERACDVNEILDRLATMNPGTPLRPRIVAFRYRIAAAAIFIIAVSVGVYFYIGDRRLTPGVSSLTSGNDIPPGGNVAILTLADGTKIKLDEARKGSLTMQGGTEVLKLDSGQLAYKVTAEAKKISLNTLETPRGGQFRINLPDGSKVWLNAASSITYPTAFTGNERNVSITGEAYFEVAKNADMPFRVKSGRQITEVVGTRFNINAYENEETIQTTLVEGLVKISGRSPNGIGSSPVILRKGQEAEIDKSGRIGPVRDTDPEEAIAWKNELFMFSGTGIETIMRRIARWYDVEVVYEGDLRHRTFTGQVSRYSNVSKVLQMLEFTGAAHFKLEGRRITVMP